MAEVTAEFAAVGITICSCVVSDLNSSITCFASDCQIFASSITVLLPFFQAETDRGRGMAVMVFHIEANLEILVPSSNPIFIVS